MGRWAEGRRGYHGAGAVVGTEADPGNIGIREPDPLQALPPAPTLAIAPHLLQPETWVSG